MHTYSTTWFETFLRSIPTAQSDAEAAFLMACLPVSRFRRLLDLCCGNGRHAVRLARVGYEVTAVDGDRDVLEGAPAVTPDNPRYRVADVRDLSGIDGPFDAAIVMWQSFGQFAARQNDAVLDALARRVRPGGRLVLDVYHRDFFEARQGTREVERAGRRVVETKSMQGGRLTVRLAYDGGAPIDEFEWELFTPSGLAGRAARCGFDAVGAYSRFDRAVAPSPDEPRFQIVLERR